MSKKRNRTLVIALICVMALLVGGVGQVSAASMKSDGKNMQKALKYFKQDKYAKAEKYAKKMSRVASQKYVDKMSTKMSKAYRKKVESYVKKYGLYLDGGDSFVWDYYLVDINNDKKVELIIVYGSSEADVQYDVFRYKSKKVKKVGTANCSHTAFYDYPKHNGIVLQNAHQGYESVDVVSMKSGKLKYKGYGTRDAGEKGEYINFGCLLKGHVNHDSNKEPYIDYGDFK